VLSEDPRSLRHVRLRAHEASSALMKHAQSHEATAAAPSTTAAPSPAGALKSFFVAWVLKNAFWVAQVLGTPIGLHSIGFALFGWIHDPRIKVMAGNGYVLCIARPPRWPLGRIPGRL